MFRQTTSAKPVTKFYLAIALSSLLLGCSNSNNNSSNQSDSTDNAVSNNETATSSSTSNNNLPTSKDSDQQVVAAVQQNLKASGIDETILSAVPTEMPDIYWVTGDGLPSFFTNKDGNYIIQGQIVKIGEEDPIDITAELQANAAQQLLAQVDKKDMVIFPAKGETKGVVYAFTDADCGYCRKLHSEIEQTNALGIEVRYLAWPRSEQTLPKMEAIWCNENRNEAMNIAKAGGNVPAASCDNPVQQQVALGFNLGVRGTPALFTESGEQLGGYLPPQQLAKAIGIE